MKLFLVALFQSIFNGNAVRTIELSRDHSSIVQHDGRVRLNGIGTHSWAELINLLFGKQFRFATVVRPSARTRSADTFSRLPSQYWTYWKYWQLSFHWVWVLAILHVFVRDAAWITFRLIEYFSIFYSHTSVHDAAWITFKLVEYSVVFSTHNHIRWFVHSTDNSRHRSWWSAGT